MQIALTYPNDNDGSLLLHELVVEKFADWRFSFKQTLLHDKPGNKSMPSNPWQEQAHDNAQG